MTKKLKTGLLVFFTAIFCVVCGIFAENSGLTGNAAEGDAVAAFEAAVELLKRDSYTEELFSDSVYVTNVKDAKDKYTEGAGAATMEVYNSVMAVFEEPFDLELFATSTLYYRLNKLNGERIYYSQNDQLTEYENIYSKYTDGTHVAVANYLNGKSGLTENLISARAETEAIKARIDAAVIAIENIKYYDAQSQTMGTYKEGAYIVLDSQESVGRKFDGSLNSGADDETNGATKALYDIYGTDFNALADEHKTISAYTAYVAAVEALEAQYSKAAEVISAIKALGGLINEDECWTKKAECEKVRASFDALKSDNAAWDETDAVDYNDLQSLIYNSDKLSEIETRLTEIENAVSETEEAIRAIGTVEYTEICKGLIENAESKFAALDKDIKDNDTQEGQTTFIVKNYVVLSAARAEYDALQAEVDVVIGSIDGLKDFEKQGNLYGEFIKTEKLYTALDDNQKATVNAQKTDYVPDGFTEGIVENYEDLYQYYQARANAIFAEAQPVIRAIGGLGAVEITQGYKARLDEVRNSYDTLSEQAKAAVYNYGALEEKEIEFDKAMESANAWIEQVEAIIIPVTVTNKEKVENAVNTFAALEQGIKDILSAKDNEYKEIYEKYENAVNERSVLLDKIGDIAAEMELLPNDEILLDENFATNVSDFDDKVTPVKTDFEALSADEKTYLRENYVSEYANFVAATDNYDQYHIEALIVAIGAVEDITIVKAEDIKAARKGYDSLSEEVKKAVRNFDGEGINPTLVAAEARLAEITDAYDSWKEKVYLLIPEDEAIEDMICVSLQTLKQLNEEYDAFVSDEKLDEIAKNAVAEYLSDAKEVLDRIILQAKTTVVGLTDEFIEIVSVPESDRYTKEYMDRLQNAMNLYLALDETQKNIFYDDETGYIAALAEAYEAFNDVYVMQVLVNDYKASVDALYANVIESNIYTVDVKVMVNTLKALYNAMPEYHGVLEEAYNRLAEVEKAFAAAEKDGAVINDKVLADEINKIISDIESLKEQYVAADALLKTEILGEVGKDLAELTENYAAEIEVIESRIDAAEAEIDKIVEDIDKLLEDYAAADTALKNELLTELAENADQLTAAYIEADNLIKTSFESKIQLLETALKDAVETLTSGYQDADKVLQARINTLVNDKIPAMEVGAEGLEKALADAREEFAAADSELRNQLNAALSRIDELEANIVPRWLSIVAVITGLIGLMGAVWFVADRFLVKK